MGPTRRLSDFSHKIRVRKFAKTVGLQKAHESLKVLHTDRSHSFLECLKDVLAPDKAVVLPVRLLKQLLKLHFFIGVNLFI